MAVSVGPASADNDVMLDVNTTPLIDVMLVLLVMLIITIPIQTHAVKIDLPINPPLNPPQVTVVQIDVDFDHTIVYQGSPVTPDQLDAYFAQIGAKPLEQQEEIHIHPDQNAYYGDVVLVMAHAQRRGARKIAVTGQDQFPDYYTEQ